MEKEKTYTETQVKEMIKEALKEGWDMHYRATHQPGHPGIAALLMLILITGSLGLIVVLPVLFHSLGMPVTILSTWVGWASLAVAGGALYWIYRIVKKADRKVKGNETVSA